MEMSWIDSCFKRKSTRYYNGKSISKESLDKIMEFSEEVLKEEHSWRRHPNVRVVYTSHDFNSGNVTNSGNDYLAIIASRNSSRDELMECGYIFQKVILFCCRIGIDTVWIGGRWLTDKFDDYYSLKSERNDDKSIHGFNPEEETVVCVTPLGYRGSPSFFASKMPFCGNGPSTRFSPSKMFFEDEAGKTMNIGKLSKEYQTILECFRWSPSACNMQKWKIVKHKNNYHFFTFPSSSFYTNIDIGIGICNWLVAAEELEVEGKFVQLDRDKTMNDDVLVRIFGENNSKISPSFFSSLNWFGFGNCIRSIGLSFYEKTKFPNSERKGNNKCIYFMSWITDNDEDLGFLFEEKKKI